MLGGKIMNGEILAIIDSLEKERGIASETLIQAIESALLSAARKKFRKDVSVQIDPHSGAIKVTLEGKEIGTDDFGYIAAQTAKQVITQKIREAEKEVIYSEYKEKTGEVLSGLVHHLEGKTVIVDLGKVEAILPLREQNPHETYRQGEHIRAYVLDVKKEARGPTVILSRTHPHLVKRLLETEVPEIHEGIVEIKSVARGRGDGTKIAVTSSEGRVDAVGACVGVKGQRIKSIVRELNGEKIDIIRWNADIKEYIKSAISPAQVLEIRIEEEKREALVIVADDQLPIAIGKAGQNVRLAPKLVDWKIDVRKISQITEKRKKTLKELKGVGPKTVELLKKAGYKTPAMIAEAKIEDLLNIPGIGKKKAEKILISAKVK